MSTSTTETNRTTISLSQAIQRYFEVSLYLLVLTAVGTLASTGTLSIPAVSFVGAALVLRGLLIARKRTLIIPERLTTILTIGYVLFYVADYFLLSGGFLNATVHLVLFVMVMRLFSAQRDRDHYFLMIIAFLMVLAAAVLTVDTVFLATFTAFLLMAIVTCILMEMKHASSNASFQSANPGDGWAHRRMAFSIARIVPILVLLIFVGAAAIFFLLPRVSAGYLGTFAAGTDLTTGFSDHVELGSIGRIQQSNALVMHIRIDGDNTGAFDLKWRGVALNQFDGRNWLNSHAKVGASPLADGSFAVRLPSLLKTSFLGTKSRTIHYRVLVEPMGSTVFFLAAIPQKLRGNYRLLAEDEGGAVYDIDTEHPINEYEATSDIEFPRAAELRTASSPSTGEALDGYLQVPSLDPRIARLAIQITAQKQNNYDRAVAIESYLRTHFAYSLQLSRTRPVDPLAEFLFVRKQGHCEYFASSMAIMLRTLGIPSRVVNGFRTGEFNELTSQYLIREKDAHSWVEAYFPGYGWASFDPTPSGNVEARTGWSRALLYLDAMEWFWREWIISYDATHQASLRQFATHDTLQWFLQLRGWVAKRYDSLLASATRTQKRWARRPVHWAFTGLLAFVLLLVVVGARKWWHLLRRARLSSNPSKFPRLAATIWYERMARRMAQKGWEKSAAQTPAEFAARIDDQNIRKRVEEFTARYEKARFGGSLEDASSLPELYEEVALASSRKKT